MSDNLGEQFKWIPNQKVRHILISHILRWHTHPTEHGVKTRAFNGMSLADMQKMHDDFHANNEFDEGAQHKHFEPKEKK